MPHLPLRQQRSPILVKFLARALPDIILNRRPRAALQEILHAPAVEPGDFHAIPHHERAVLGLHENPQIGGRDVLVARVGGAGAVEGEFEAGEAGGVGAHGVADLAFGPFGFLLEVEAAEEVVEFGLPASLGCDADFGCGGGGVAFDA